MIRYSGYKLASSHSAHIPFSEHMHSSLHSNCPLQLFNFEDEETWDSETSSNLFNIKKLISTRLGKHFLRCMPSLVPGALHICRSNTCSQVWLTPKTLLLPALYAALWLGVQVLFFHFEQWQIFNWCLLIYHNAFCVFWVCVFLHKDEKITNHHKQHDKVILALLLTVFLKQRTINSGRI